MPIIDLTYGAGTLAEPQNTDSTELRWAKTNKVHFPDRDLTPIPAFDEASGAAGSVTISGTCRAQWAGRLGGSTSIAGAYYLFGTHSHLYAEYKSVRYNITPFAGSRFYYLGTDPLDATNTDATLVINATAHGLAIGDRVTISGASDVGGVDADTYINITHIVATVPNANSITVELGTTASSTASGGGDVVSLYSEEITKTLGSGPLATFYDTAQTNPIVTTSGSREIRILTAGEDAINVGDMLEVSGIAGSGGTLNGIPLAEINTTHTITRISGTQLYTLVTTAATSSGSPTEASSVIAAKLVEVSETAHNRSEGDRIKLAGVASAFGGIPASEINKEHVITKVRDADNYMISVTTSPTSSAAGGGTACVLFQGIAAGTENQTFKSGFGAGLFGKGLFGRDRTSTATPAYPRISSFDNFGNKYLYCPGDYTAGDGQKIYEWDGDKTLAPTVMIDAPENCNWVAVVANQVVALCGTNIVIALTDATTGQPQWPTVPSTTPIGDVLPVQRSTRLLSIAPFGEKSAIVFAPEPLLLRLVGGVWDLVELGSEYPIVAPAAFCRIDDGVMWYAEDGNYYFCDGGSVRKIVNRQNGEWVRERLNKNAIWTSFMLDDQKHDQAWHYYPSTGQSNPDSYVIINQQNESFTTGSQGRTAAQRPSVVDNRFYMADESTIYNSFTINQTDFAWSAKTAFFYIDPEYRFKITRLYPNASFSGEITIKLYGKDYPQSDEVLYGTYTMDSNTTIMTVRAAAKLIAIEFSGSTDSTLPKFKMEAVRAGKRRV